MSRRSKRRRPWTRQKKHIRRRLLAISDCCRWCGKYLAADMTIDHIVPLAAGGTHDMDNLTLAHFSCNQTRPGGAP